MKNIVKLFNVVFIINVLVMYFSIFYPSMDGPSHLYNANLLKELILGNEFIAEFHSINHFYLPNWLSHLFLSLLLFVFPAWISEKILILIYILGMVFSFKFLVNQITENEFLTFLIFPFIYTFLFHLGFYNFSLSFIFYFWITAYWIKNFDNLDFKKVIVLFFLLSLTYYSNVLIFGFTGLTLGIFTVYKILVFQKLNFKTKLKLFSTKTGILLLISFPTIILLSIFYSNVHFFGNGESLRTIDLLKWLTDNRALIVYSYDKEEFYTTMFLFTLFFMIGVSSQYYFDSKLKLDYNKKVYVFSFGTLTIIALSMYFIIPDNSGAVMMSNRMIVILFIILIIFISAFVINSKPIKIAFLIYIISHLSLLFLHQKELLKLDKDAMEISDCSKYIDKNKIVLPINFSDNWLQGHFGDYLGIDKSMIIIDNYEAGVNWFPIAYNKGIHDRLELSKNLILNEKLSDIIKKIEIDYILIYGIYSKIDDANWENLRYNISNHYNLKYQSDNKYVTLYEIK